MLFRLCTLLLVLVLASASWAAFGAGGGTAVSIILLALAIQIWPRRCGWRRSVRISAAMLWFLALVCLLAPAINAAREAANCMQCRNNLKQIAFGLRAYWDCNGCYPPPCTYDKVGPPIQSWRLLIMPYLSAMPGYQTYNFNEAWDAPSNRRALEEYPSIYACPTAQPWPRASTTTNYVAVVGSKARWIWHKELSREDHDQQEHAPDTFLVIEMGDSQVRWTEPKDVRFDDVQALRSLAAHGPHWRNNGYFFHETPGVNAVLVDGDRIFMFPCDSTPNALTSLLPPNEATTGFKDIPQNHFYTEELQINWPHCIGLPTWVVTVGLLLYQVMRNRKVRQQEATTRP